MDVGSAGARTSTVPGAAPGSEAGTTTSGAEAATPGAGATTSGTTAAPESDGSPAGENDAAGGTEAAPCDGLANQVGVTDDTITIADVSDISRPVPGLLDSAQVGVLAYLAYVNSTSDNCGRTLELPVHALRLAPSPSSARHARSVSVGLLHEVARGRPRKDSDVGLTTLLQATRNSWSVAGWAVLGGQMLRSTRRRPLNRMLGRMAPGRTATAGCSPRAPDGGRRRRRWVSWPPSYPRLVRRRRHGRAPSPLLEVDQQPSLHDRKDGLEGHAVGQGAVRGQGQQAYDVAAHIVGTCAPAGIGVATASAASWTRSGLRGRRGRHSRARSRRSRSR